MKRRAATRPGPGRAGKSKSARPAVSPVRELAKALRFGKETVRATFQESTLRKRTSTSPKAFLSQLLLKFAERRHDGNSISEDVNFRFNRDGGQGAIAAIVDVIDGRGEHLGLQSLCNFGWCLGVLAPFNFQLQMMRRDAAPRLVVSHALINQSIHALDKLVCGQPAFGVDCAPQLAVDNIADALQNAAH